MHGTAMRAMAVLQRARSAADVRAALDAALPLVRHLPALDGEIEIARQRLVAAGGGRRRRAPRARRVAAAAGGGVAAAAGAARRAAALPAAPPPPMSVEEREAWGCGCSPHAAFTSTVSLTTRS